jgi:hypothetical protein
MTGAWGAGRGWAGWARQGWVGALAASRLLCVPAHLGSRGARLTTRATLPRCTRSANNKLVWQEAQLGQLQRMVRSLTVDADDKFVYAGTTSGDVLQARRGGGGGRGGGVKEPGDGGGSVPRAPCTGAVARHRRNGRQRRGLGKRCPHQAARRHPLHARTQVSLDGVTLRNTGPAKAPLQLGVTATAPARAPGLLLLGSGDGVVALMATAAATSPASPRKLKPMGVVATARLEGGVSSIVVEGAATAVAPGRAGRGSDGGGNSPGVNFTALVGTQASNIYRVTYDAAART